MGVSFRSREEAAELAKAQAQLMLEAALSGRSGEPDNYAYLANRKTEPLVTTLDGPAGPAGRITVNGYGALVLNATSALFVDIDTRDDDPLESEPPPQVVDAQARHTELRFRTYRTRGGWRLLCVNQGFDPVSPESAALLADFGSDPRYVVLCRVQQSFRARLTPKPWRAGFRPQEIPPGESVRRAEVQRYIDRTWRYATTRHVGGADPDEAVADVLPIIEFHDRWTQATSGKPLA